ncbi:MAG: hypothetical protein WCD16_02110 [Paracoccaceae bacterium]
MEIVNHLESLRQKFPECETAAFGDISTGLILTVRSEHKQPQERLDRLCLTAQELLDGRTAALAAPALSLGGDPLQVALSITGDKIELFLRSPEVPTDALCFVCARDVDIDALIASASAGLRDIGKDQASSGPGR